MKILITGTAGFIGFHLTKKLIELGDDIFGIDSINDYYDVELKFARLNECVIAAGNIAWRNEVKSSIYTNYRFVRMSLEGKNELLSLCAKKKFDIIVHSARAGVRYPITNPDVYAQSNLIGFLNILEAARYHKIKHLVYASSSSVYGLNAKMPFEVFDNVDHPVLLYAATKKANELMAHTYSHLYKLPTTGLPSFSQG